MPAASLMTVATYSRRIGFLECALVRDAPSQPEHSLQGLHCSKVLASMSEHFDDRDTVRVVRRERFSRDGGKHLRYQGVVQLGQYRVEVVECFFGVFDDSFLGGKRHRGCLKIRQARSPVLKAKIDRTQTPPGTDVPLLPHLPCRTKVAQGRRVMKQNFSQVVVPPRYVPKVPADRLGPMFGTPPELLLRKLIDHREDCLMAPGVLPGEQRECLARVSLGAGRTSHPRHYLLVMRSRLNATDRTDASA